MQSLLYSCCTAIVYDGKIPKKGGSLVTFARRKRAQVSFPLQTYTWWLSDIIFSKNPSDTTQRSQKPLAFFKRRERKMACRVFIFFLCRIIFQGSASATLCNFVPPEADYTSPSCTKIQCTLSI